MSIAKYRVFIRTVELQSMTRAAEDLGYTQSGVSHILAALEGEFGFALLTRSHSGVMPTPAGMRLLPHMRMILNAHEQLRQEAAAIKGIMVGSVRIGVFTSVAVNWLPGIIKAFQTDYPDIDLKLMNGDYYDIEHWISEGTVDLGFVTLPIQSRYNCLPLKEDRLLAVLPTDHPLASMDVFPLKKFETEPFISLLEESDHDMRRVLTRRGIVPNVKYTTKDDYAIIAMVENGLGVSIMPELVLKGMKANVCVKEMETHDRRTIALASSQFLSTAGLKFQEYVVEWVSKNA